MMKSRRFREEEQDSVLLLENLVAEFEVKFFDLGSNIGDFLHTYWKERMVEVMTERQPLNKEEVQRMRDIGVVVFGPEPPKGFYQGTTR